MCVFLQRRRQLRGDDHDKSHTALHRQSDVETTSHLQIVLWNRRWILSVWRANVLHEIRIVDVRRIHGEKPLTGGGGGGGGDAVQLDCPDCFSCPVGKQVITGGWKLFQSRVTTEVATRVHIYCIQEGSFNTQNSFSWKVFFFFLNLFILKIFYITQNYKFLLLWNISL